MTTSDRRKEKPLWEAVCLAIMPGFTPFPDCRATFFLRLDGCSTATADKSAARPDEG